jgi:zinc protease
VVDSVIADVGQNTVRAEDLERVKTQLIAEAIYAQDNQATLAHWYGASLAAGLGLEDVAQWPERIEAVTPDDVKKAALWLDKRRSVTGFLLPAESYPASTGADTIDSLAL